MTTYLRTGSMSAFAARKAVEEPLCNTVINESANNTTSSKISQKSSSFPRPLKRQKANTNTKSTTLLKSQQISSSGKLGEAVGPRIFDVRYTSKSSASLQQPEESEDTEAESDNDNTTGNLNSSGDEFIAPSLVSVQQLSVFVPTQENILRDLESEWTVRLQENDVVTLVGQYDLWVHRGAVSISGAVLHASSSLHRVYAPSTHSLPSIRYTRNPYGPEHQPADITIFSCNSRIRLLRQLSSKFARIWNDKHTRALQPLLLTDWEDRSFAALISSAQDPSKRPLQLIVTTLDWDSAIAKLSANEATRVKAMIVCGPKGSGKSTFSRILMNNILTKAPPYTRSNSQLRSDGVALLDLDPGQPEFSPPGEISLTHLRSCNFGAPFTHPVPPPSQGNRTVRAHHLGSTSPKDDPVHFLNCASELVFQYRQMLTLYPSCPLIVNCSGWIQGSGLEVLTELIYKLKPTEVIYMSTSGPTEVVEVLEDTARKSSTLFYTLTSQPSAYMTRTAAELRTMQALSYFHLDDSEVCNLRWNAIPITKMRSFDLSYAGAEQAVLGILILGEAQDPDFLFHVLEGSIVGLVVLEEGLSNLWRDRQDKYYSTEGMQLDLMGQITCPQNASAPREQNCSSDYDSRLLALPYHPEKGRNYANFPADHATTDLRPVSSDLRFDSSSISRTAEGLPYFATSTGICRPPDPYQSHSLGQALVRSIHPESKTIQLVTPIPQETLQQFHRGNPKIVLVRGKLDTPTWAYQEDFAIATPKSHKKSKLSDVHEWAEQVPWVKSVAGNEANSKRTMVWKVQRNVIRDDSSTGGETSS